MHEGVFKLDPKPFFLVVEATIKKFGEGKKTYVFETEEETFRFLKNISNKTLILHMTNYPSRKFIRNLKHLSEKNKTIFEVPFVKFHPPHDIQPYVLSGNNGVNTEGVLVKEYNGYCNGDMKRCLGIK